MADPLQQTEVVSLKPASKRGLAITILIVLGVGLAIYWPFVFGDGVLLYRDIGKDSLSSYYTDFVHLSNYIRSDGFPSWSFHIGMGQDLAYATGFLFWEPVCWLPARFIALALVYQHLFKTMIAGLLFYRYLRLLAAPLPTAMLGALVIAFSAYMTLGSCWTLLAEELLVFTALLLGVEIALQRGRWLLLVVSVALVGWINPFYLYLCALFLCCYVPARLFARNGWRPGPIFKRSIIIAALAFLGVALGAAITFPCLKVVLNSPRGAGATNSLALLGSYPVFALESAPHYVAALLRPLSNEFLGAGDAFRGWQNYLEAPQTYCGLVCLLLFPQALVGGTRRYRIIVVLFILWLVIPTVFPWFRYLFWLFKGDYYRTYSLFSVLGLVTISLLALKRYLERSSFSVWLLLASAAGLIGVLYLPIESLQSVIDPRIRIAVSVYLALYAAILVAGRLANRQLLAAYSLVVLTIVELIHFNHISVAQRDFVKKAELVGGMAANRDAVQAVGELKQNDNSFYRTTLLRSGTGTAEIEPNEAMLLNFYGTSSYGSFNDYNYIRFLDAVEALPSHRETDTRFAIGLAGNFVISLFAGEKYALIEDPEPYQKAAQYELVRSYGKSFLFRNAFSLPLGLGFTRYLPESEFLQLPRDAKEQVLLAVAVLNPASLGGLQGLKPVTVSDLEKEFAASSFPALVQQRRAGALYLRSFAQNRLAGDIRLEQDGVLILQTPFNSGWQAWENGHQVGVVPADVGLLALPVKTGEHAIELRYRNPWLVGSVVTSAVAVLLVVGLLFRKQRLAVSFA